MLEAVVCGQIGERRIDARIDTGAGPLVLVGPNGSGKTTLLLMILGVRRPASGRIAIGENVLFDSSRRIDVAVEERRLGYVPQDYALFPHLTVLKNVEFGCRGDAKSRRAHAERLVEELGLSAMARRRPTELSGGERQKVALARALAAEPRALLLDEPLAALDVAARREVRSSLATYLRGLGLPAVIVTHDPADASAFGNRIAVLEAGVIVQTGTWEELQARPGSSFIRQFATPV